jgi:hypothetical protein
MSNLPDTLDQLCIRLSQQSLIEQNQAQYLSEMGLLLREQSQALRQRSHELRAIVTHFRAGPERRGEESGGRARHMGPMEPGGS